MSDSEARSVIRNLRVSPQAEPCCGDDSAWMQQGDCHADISRRRISGDVKKALQSAIANAENNHSLDVDRLYVKEAHVGKGLVMKRFGRAQRAAVRGF